MPPPAAHENSAPGACPGTAGPTAVGTDGATTGAMDVGPNTGRVGAAVAAGALGKRRPGGGRGGNPAAAGGGDGAGAGATSAPSSLTVADAGGAMDDVLPRAVEGVGAAMVVAGGAAAADEAGVEVDSDTSHKPIVGANSGLGGLDGGPAPTADGWSVPEAGFALPLDLGLAGGAAAVCMPHPDDSIAAGMKGPKEEPLPAPAPLVARPCPLTLPADDTDERRDPDAVTARDRCGGGADGSGGGPRRGGHGVGASTTSATAIEAPSALWIPPSTTHGGTAPGAASCGTARL